MAHIRSRKHSNSSHLLALVAAALPIAAHAQQNETALPAMTVKANAEVPYKADAVANPKFTQALVDTPQTVQVIKKELLREQGAASLMEALRNTPGITMQLGENGNTSAGDAFTMRGFNTATATFVDGVRDLGAVTRDVFNVEQIEVVKGPAGADIGRGSQSGYINLISKLPQAGDINFATVGLGTDNYRRLTADLNKQIGENTAVRVNVMGQDADVPGRDIVTNRCVGIAPSVAFGLNSPTRFYLYSQHVRQDNVPDGGIPTIGWPGFFFPNGSSGAKVNRENFYGSKDDYEKVAGDMVSGKFEHDFGGGTVLRNLTRYGRSTMDRVLTGVSPANGTAGITQTVLADPSTWTVTRNRQRVDQENEIIANQTSLNFEFNTGGIKHAVATGLELMRESQDARLFSTAGLTIPVANLYNPNSNVSLPIPYSVGGQTNGSTTTAAAYVFDTLKLTERFQIDGGVRYEHFKTETDSVTVTQNATTGAITAVTPFSGSLSDNLLSWKIGTLYKPAENGSVYAAYAKSYTPPGSANFALSGTAGNQQNAGLEPQETINIEVGTKWELLNKRLNVNAALYRTENDKQTTQDPVTQQVSQSGRTRVEGIELGLVGQLTNFWQITAGIAKMKTKQLDQIAVNATTGVVTQTDAVRWAPDLTATLWTSYTLGDFTLGGGARYVSDQKRVINNAAPASMPLIPSYWVADLMAAYKVSKNVNLRLNVNNVFDKEYINTLNNGGSRMTMGAPRTAILAAELLF